MNEELEQLKKIEQNNSLLQSRIYMALLYQGEKINVEVMEKTTEAAHAYNAILTDCYNALIS